jgi:hypothetical protein
MLLRLLYVCCTNAAKIAGIQQTKIADVLTNVSVTFNNRLENVTNV